MLAPVKWLYEFVPCDMNAKELAELFTTKGVEVKSVLKVGEILENFIIAEVKSATYAKAVLFDGNNTIEVSAPAFNLQPQDKVAYNPKELKLLNSIIAQTGQDSLPIVLDNNYALGKSILDYLDDYVLDLEILPNRSDLMSIIGLARELASYEEINREFKNQFSHKSLKQDNHKIQELLELSVDKQGCSDYIARLIFDVTIAPSPFWLQWRLITIGLRPINNVVDATNYIMMKYGTPLHAFDYDKILDHTIEVRFAKKGEKIRTIDGEMRNLNENVLVIADKKYPIALAGIMGGIDSEISSSTKRTLLECARFNPKVIRRASKQLNLSTEASQRFEMGIDSQILEIASAEVSNLIANLSSGTIVKDKLEIRTFDKSIDIKLSLAKVNSLLGINFEKERVRKILHKLNYQFIEENNTFSINIPSYRLDLRREVDLIEEIARIYGYDNLPSIFVLRGREAGTIDNLTKALNYIRDFFVGCNFIENYTISFCDEKIAKEFVSDEIVKIPVPLNERYAILRPLILTTLLESVRINYSRGNKNLRLFEIGKAFQKNKELQELLHLSAVMVGDNFPVFWKKGSDSSVDYFDLKGVLESFFEFLKIKDIEYHETTQKFLTLHNAVDIKYANSTIGYLGEINKKILGKYDIPVAVYGMEIDIDALLRLAPSYRFFQQLPRFPSVIRDFAFLVDDTISSAKIVKSIEKVAGVLLESVEIFDYFQGKPLPVGKRNLGVRISLRSDERTLTQTEINNIFERIVNYLKDQWQIDLRA